MPYQLVLASTSPFRKALLARLQLPFDTIAPDVDETPLPGEQAADLARRLAVAKARQVGQQFAGTPRLVIGSDQTVDLDGRILGKPGNQTQAIEQLVAQSGQTVTFHTGLSVYACDLADEMTTVECYRVRLRSLTTAQARTYLQKEPAFDAAGSFYSEGLGIALFEYFDGRDPNSLIGLPLMALVDMLSAHGVDVLGEAAFDAP